jgi:predicted ester cyclase
MNGAVYSTPTGKKITAAGISMHRVVDGRLVEKWSQADFVGFLQQLGAIPAAAPA